MPLTPCPAVCVKFSAFLSSIPSALSTIALASGCSDKASIEAASVNSSVSLMPFGAMSVTDGLPSVIVPVLSSTTVSILCAVSRLSADFVSIPSCAPLPVPTIIAVGVASPNAQGQEITSTDIAIVSAWLTP